MIDKPVSFSSADPSTRQDGEASAQDDLATLLRGWVRACLDDGVQELHTMIMTASDSLKSARTAEMIEASVSMRGPLCVVA